MYRIRRNRRRGSQPVFYFMTISGLLLLAGLAGCRSTKFKDNPPKHRFAEELEKVGHPYYFNVKNGVFSRLAGILDKEERDKTISGLKDNWEILEAQESAETLLQRLQEAGLETAAVRIEQTLSANAGGAPAAINKHAQVTAIKYGIWEAIQQVKPSGG